MVHELAQLGFGQARQLAQFFEGEFVTLVKPRRLFDFHFAASSPKCPRGLKVDAWASSL